MKKIITHLNPDLDAVASVWLIKHFLPASPARLAAKRAGGPEWKEAEVDFVPAGKAEGVDTNPEILYVDTGLGKLDHHQTSKYTSATELCWQFILCQRKDKKFSLLEKEALVRLVKIVTEIDNAGDIKWPEVKQDRCKFYLHNLLDGITSGELDTLDFGFKALDGFLTKIKNKIKAEQELKKGIEFQAKWGKAIALQTGNKEVLWEGEVSGFCLVVMKYPDSGGIRIYGRPDTKIDLTKAYNKVKELDPESDWFLHASKKLLLNQSNVNPNLNPTKLTLEQIIEVLKK